MGRILLKTHCPKGHPLSGDNLYARNDVVVNAGPAAELEVCGSASQEKPSR